MVKKKKQNSMNETEKETEIEQAMRWASGEKC